MRLNVASGREGLSVPRYLAEVFASVDWTMWLAWMIPYSLAFFIIDTLVLWRGINWWNAKISFKKLLPIRASSYILSIVNEQVGKGGIALYLNRRDGVPGWELGSTMLLIMFCEFLYLLAWASLGVILSLSEIPPGLELIRIIPWLGLFGLFAFGIVVTIFRSEGFAKQTILNRALFSTFFKASASQYGIVMALRSPALLGAVVVYSHTLSLFGVNVTFLQMLCVLPIIFFGTFIPGPFRAVAVAMWPTFFPDDPGAMAAYGFVQHNFFVLFNAAIGLVFLPRANRELFAKRNASSLE